MICVPRGGSLPRRSWLLLPVAGMVLAYLLDPIASRIERLEVNRLVATLVIIVVVITAIALLIALIAPIIISELAYFIESFPNTLDGYNP